MNDFIPEDARLEVKFVAEATRYRELERWILLNTAGFKTAYPPRRVNNVYFDTPDLFAYAENLSGTSDRAKVRLRWYGDTAAPASTVLEVKRRRNHLGWKHHYRGGPLDFRSGTWTMLRRRLRASLVPEGKLWLDAHPTPVLINRYDRLYFETPDGSLRATLDRHQAVFDQRLKSRPNLRYRSNLPDSVVVEIKFHRADRRRATEVIEGLPLRVSRNSKYVIGVRSILQPLGG